MLRGSMSSLYYQPVSEACLIEEELGDAPSLVGGRNSIIKRFGAALNTARPNDYDRD